LRPTEARLDRCNFLVRQANNPDGTAVIQAVGEINEPFRRRTVRALSSIFDQRPLEHLKNIMSELINRALYHPSVAGPIFYLTDVMVVVDFSVAGTAMMLTAKLGHQLLKPIGLSAKRVACRTSQARDVPHNPACA
jgi:hypothetical protein